MMKEKNPVNNDRFNKIAGSILNGIPDERKKTFLEISDIIDELRPFSKDERKEFSRRCSYGGEIMGFLHEWGGLSNHSEMSEEMKRSFKIRVLSFFLK